MGHSLGMIAVSAEGDRYLNSILLGKNQPIPSSKTRPYRATLSARDANEVSVYLTQGESEHPASVSFVGKYVIERVVPEASGEAVLDISYAYDADGVVTVSASSRPGGMSLPVRKEPLPLDMSWLFEKPGSKAALHKTVYLAIDLSGSMSGRPLADAQQAMRAFVEKSDLTHTSVGLIGFSDRVRVAEKALQDSQRILKAITKLEINEKLGYGNATHPFDEAHGLLANQPGSRYLVVLADGVWSNQPRAITCAKRCHAAGIEVIAIGFGGADKAFLKAIASSDEGALYTPNLQGAFESIAQVIVQGGVTRLDAARR
jgi:hypothetical protein